MAEVRVNVYVHAKRDDVFALVSDHEKFIRGGLVRSCTVVTEGTDDRNGLGCMREIVTPGIRFVEEITVFQRPSRFDYLIRETNLPIHHEGGSLRFHERGPGTEIDWVSLFSIPVPLLGGALARLAATNLTAAFTQLLLNAKSELER